MDPDPRQAPVLRRIRDPLAADPLPLRSGFAATQRRHEKGRNPLFPRCEGGFCKAQLCAHRAGLASLTSGGRVRQEKELDAFETKPLLSRAGESDPTSPSSGESAATGRLFLRRPREQKRGMPHAWQELHAMTQLSMVSRDRLPEAGPPGTRRGVGISYTLPTVPNKACLIKGLRPLRRGMAPRFFFLGEVYEIHSILNWRWESVDPVYGTWAISPRQNSFA